MEGGRSVRCKLCPQILSEVSVGVHFQRVHSRQFGRVVLWKCGECGLEARMPETQLVHDEGVKAKTLACTRRARLNEQFFQKIGPISHSRRTPSNSLDLSRPLPDSLPKFFGALQIVKQNSLVSQSVDEDPAEELLMVPPEDTDRPRSAPPHKPLSDQLDEMKEPCPIRRFRQLERGSVEEGPQTTVIKNHKDEGEMQMEL